MCKGIRTKKRCELKNFLNKYTVDFLKNVQRNKKKGKVTGKASS
jgi:hypothetical protein